MNKKWFARIILFVVLCATACSNITGETIDTGAGPITSVTSLAEPATRTVTPIEAITPTDTPIFTSTFTKIPPTPTPILTVGEMWIFNHNEERIRLFGIQGGAETIPVLEYHGDDYFFTFSNGAVVELGPSGFRRQMQWFHENSVHAVTGDELIKWLHGEIELPKRSVALTFDLGNRSGVSITRMLAVFEEYGMHGIFTIMVAQTEEGGSKMCLTNDCLVAFLEAYNSGMATIGSHTITHRDFADVSAEDGLAELAESKRIIEEGIGNGCVVNTLTWPFESIPQWGERIGEVGFEAAFGGNTYPILENAIQRAKPEDWYKLPRILPPNSNGISGRPNNKTLLEIMTMYTGGW